MNQVKLLKTTLVFCLMSFFCALQNANALDVQFFEPVPWVSRGVTVFGSNTIHQNAFETGVYLNWALDPIEIGLTRSNARIDSLVDNQISLDLQFAYGITDYITLSTDLPLYIFYDVEPLGSSARQHGSALGDIRLNLIMNLISIDDPTFNSWGMALIPFLTIPVGNEDKFIGNSSFTGGLRFIVDKKLGEKNYIKLNTGIRIREEERIGNLVVGHEMFSSLGYTRTLWPAKDLYVFAEVKGSTTFQKFMQEEISSPVELIVGGRKSWFDQKLQTVFGVGRGLNVGYGAPEFRFFTGATLALGNNPGATQDPVILPVGKIELSVQLADGTPYKSQIHFRDLNINQDTDNVEADKFEKKLAPGRYKFLVQAEGYENEPGLVTIADKKLTRVQIILRKRLDDRIETIRPVLFDLDKDTIKQESEEVIDKVIGVLEQYPEITKLQAEAHTDSKASVLYNIRLSEKRAKSVRQYLVSHGVPEDKIFSKGYAAYKPIDTNDTKEGRARNRRVEFIILEKLPVTLQIKEYEPSELYNLEK